MKTHYYLDWYEDKGFSEKLVKALDMDIVDRKSLVFISGERTNENPTNNDQSDVSNLTEKSWFDRANILFDEYYFIGHNTHKEEAQKLIQEASVIFLCGGYTPYQMQLITKLELTDLIKDKNGVIMGTSAGGMNMSEAYVEEGKIYKGLGLHHFSFEAHFDHANTSLVEDRFVLSEHMDIYVAAEQDGAVRVKGNQIHIIDNVYLISGAEIRKLAKDAVFDGNHI